MHKIIKLIFLGLFLLGQIPATFAATACGVVDSSLQGSFEGGCKEGKADGYGIASGTDRYEGDFALGRPHGKGSYIWSDGERYDGEFLNGRMTGKGAYKFKNGDRYEGEFADGMRSGKASPNALFQTLKGTTMNNILPLFCSFDDFCKWFISLWENSLLAENTNYKKREFTMSPA